MCETNIVALHDQTPQISLPDPPSLRSRPHSRHLTRTFFLSRRAKDFSSSSSFSQTKVMRSYYKCFSSLEKVAVFFSFRRLISMGGGEETFSAFFSHFFVNNLNPKLIFFFFSRIRFPSSKRSLGKRRAKLSLYREINIAFRERERTKLYAVHISS